MNIGAGARFDPLRLWGVEIEYLGGRNVRTRLPAELARRGIVVQIERYTHERSSHWKIVPDGSCGLELVSPPLQGPEGFRQLHLVCEALVAAEVQVDERCGLHVHHDARTLGIEISRRLLIFYARYEEVIDSLLAPSRRANRNEFCYSLRNGSPSYWLPQLAGSGANGSSERDRLERLFGRSRYLKVNLQSFLRHGTIEFRQHHGTIQEEAIHAWIVFTQAMLNRCIDRSVPLTGRGTHREKQRWPNLVASLCGHPFQGCDQECAQALAVLERSRQFWKNNP